GDMGNTLVVVEHDEDTIRRADHIIDIGPSAGKRGGRVVAQGSVADLSASADSLTGRYLLHAMKHPLQARRPVLAFSAAAGDAGTPGSSYGKPKSSPGVPASPAGVGEPAAGVDWLEVRGASLHNLQKLDVAVPLKRLVVVTGVS